MTVVVGTAGHIDHGKTALLRARTGIDADRLPEERRRGMTIDVGYAHLGLPDGTELDFVDVPGHDRLVGNMLVGAGEIDAVMLVIAADDGPRAQTLEHLELLDALGLNHGIAVITKADLADAARIAQVRDDVDRLLAGTALAGSPVLAVSSVDGRGIDALRADLVELRDRVAPGAAGSADRPGANTPRTARAAGAATTSDSNPSRLAIDRVFTVKGRGLVVTGTLRGGPLARNTTLRLVPGGGSVRARELQVHGRAVEQTGPGRTAINLAGAEAAELHRGAVLTNDPAVMATDRLLVRLTRPMPDRTRVRVHLGTASADGAIGRAGRDAIDLPGAAAAAILRLALPIAAAPGDRLVLRRASGPDRVVGGVVLDVAPPRGISRRRQSGERVRRLAEAIDTGGPTSAAVARLDLHGALSGPAGGIVLADDVIEAVTSDVLAALEGDRSGADEARPGLGAVRARAVRALRRVVTLRRDDANVAAAALIERLVAGGRLVRDGERLRLAGTDPIAPAGTDPGLALAMDRLERALAVAGPPPLAEAAKMAVCPAAGIRELERTGRIVVLDVDLAYSTSTYRALEAQALDLASRAPLTPAALRDATGTSRKYVMAILADLDRRGILRRTEGGHLPGPRAPAVRIPSGTAPGDP
ncbi:MAG: SelB C-terminal domain-containing protein [Candidatus Limnocylindrales bacterium]|nr:SelB C-terminal domain-containing protein [Candidatus Limnocylindrales bacterium]